MRLSADDGQLRALVRRTRVFLLDLDGTVYIGDEPIGPMARTLAAVRSSGRKLVFCTNNSSKSAQAYARKLKKLGLFGREDEVYTSGIAAAEYLRANFAGKRVFLVGTAALRREFSARGIALDDADPDVCVLAYDTALTFRKLALFNRFLAEGKPYIATHADAVCPAKGVYPPDVGSFIELLRCSSGRVPDVVCGKPGPVMGGLLASRLGVAANEVAMVGDRPYTDIRFGNNNGFGTVLVLSGETDAAAAEKLPPSDRPQAILNSFNDIEKYL